MFLRGLPAASIRALVLGSALALTAPSFAQEPAEPASAGEALAPEVQAVVDKIEARYKTVDTIQAGFTQVKRDAFGEVQQQGDLVLQRPTKMRWRFTTGDEQMFVSDGSTLWIYSKAENQVLRISDTSQASSTANTFLTSLDSLDELFHIEAMSDDSGHTLKLVPRKKGMYKRIQLSVTPELVLRRAVFEDEYGNVTDLSFKDVVLDGTVDPKTFVFEVPEGAKVIDN